MDGWLDGWMDGWLDGWIDGWMDRRHPPHWLSSKDTNYHRGILLICAGAIEGHFDGKMPRGGQQGGFVLARQGRRSSGTCNPEYTGLHGLPVSWSPTLFSRSGPFGLRSVRWTDKTIERSLMFLRRVDHCCRGDMVGWTSFWILFEWLANVRARC